MMRRTLRVSVLIVSLLAASVFMVSAIQSLTGGRPADASETAILEHAERFVRHAPAYTDQAGVLEPDALFPRQQFGFQGAAFSETADAEDSESQHASLVVYTLHDGVMAGRPHESWRIAEQHF